LITYGAALSHAELQQNIIAQDAMTYIVVTVRLLYVMASATGQRENPNKSLK